MCHEIPEFRKACHRCDTRILFELKDVKLTPAHRICSLFLEHIKVIVYISSVSNQMRFAEL